MTKLSNGIEYENPNLPVEFAEYLLHNGFKNSKSKNGDLRFYISNAIDVFVRGNQVEVIKHIPSQKTFGFDPTFWQSHSGINMLDFHGWITLMHIMHVVLLRQYLQNSLKINVQSATEAAFVLESLSDSQFQK